MCLTYKPIDLSTLPETIVAYKVYMQLAGCLYSPYFSNKNNGEVTCAGMYENNALPVRCTASEPIPEHPVVARRASVIINLPIDPCFTNWDLDIEGFHVITTKDQAEIYRHLLSSIFNERNREYLFLPDYVIVPVVINKQDIYATGETPTLIAPITTYVTNKITITGGAFAKAISIMRNPCEEITTPMTNT